MRQWDGHEPWLEGQTIVHKEFWQGRLWGAHPLFVVEDSFDRLVAWCPRGTVRKVPITPPTRDKAPTRAERVTALLDRGDWLLEDREWDVSTLWLVEPDRWHAVLVSWLPDGKHWGWYVNFQEPIRRTERGFQSMDLMLDILVDPDLSWRWKDEDELDAVIKAGLYDESIVNAVRTDAREVVQRIESNDRPFNEPWPRWRPAHEWGLPMLPHGWETCD